MRAGASISLSVYIQREIYYLLVSHTALSIATAAVDTGDTIGWTGVDISEDVPKTGAKLRSTLGVIQNAPKHNFIYNFIHHYW